MQPVLQELNSRKSQITDVHFFSDGPTTQCRNKQNFFLLSTILYAFGFDYGSWNFFESGHGKGAPDAIGGSIKRQADALVLTGCDIPDARKLYHFLDTADSAVKLNFIEESDINYLETQCSKTLKAITGTMKLHQVQTDKEFSLLHRDLSCFCQRPTVCSCYNIRRSQFPVVSIYN